MFLKEMISFLGKVGLLGVWIFYFSFIFLCRRFVSLIIKIKLGLVLEKINFKLYNVD